MASGSELKLWRASDGNLLRSFQDSSYVNTVAFSPDGKTLAAGTGLSWQGGGTVDLWDIETGSLIRTIAAHSNAVYSVVFSPDGTRLVSGSEDEAIRVWSVSDGTLLFSIPNILGDVHCLSFSPDGQYFVSGSLWSNGLRMWRASDGAFVRSFPGADFIRSAAFSPDGARIVTGTFRPPYMTESSVNIWRVSDGVLEITASNYSNWVYQVAFSPDGDSVASADYQGALRLWRAADGSLVRTLNPTGDPMRALSFSPSGTELLSGNNSLQLWSLSNGTTIPRYAGHVGSIQSLAVGDSAIASGGADGVIRFWRSSDGVLIRELIGHSEVIWNVAFSSDGSLLASQSRDETIKIWLTANGTLLRTISGYGAWFFHGGLAFSRDNSQIISTGTNQTLQVWKVADGSPIKALPSREGRGRFVLPSPDGAFLLSGGNMTPPEADESVGYLTLVTATDGALVWSVLAHGGGMSATASFSPDGQLIVTGGVDGVVKVWRAETGQLERSILGHVYDVVAVGFSMAGDLLVTAGAGLIKIWRVSDGAFLTAFDCEPGATSLNFTPDGKALLYGRGDGTLIAAAIPAILKIYQHSSNSPVKLSVDGPRQVLSQLEISPDLREWTPFTNVMGTNGTVWIEDPSFTSQRRRFYRLAP